ncbi:CGNR zinc finger domain-containing protein [Goodfellowiella coeruleoviolacea]|uniref:Conserved protein containing a Zn-ribbon-like motif, possibly RNA-binding n=1 Tax=Goodfellowiella coeruleoviolacea TaxID=334858 RepID=A0AAE3KQ24_9PSEU|nr:CGNR zinc finger domain-containing protein [Goodfellowiella coeruleoviolacea]MCP2170498.1 Conserved protein containing a Zn-ribbon-like motif, possibly RNA-binding [Goodfellowiella coeruleoviolacea]
MPTPEGILLPLLNSRPVDNGRQHDALADPDEGRRWLRDHGGQGTEAELAHLRRARDLLDAVVRGNAPAEDLAPLLRGVRRVPVLRDGELDWELQVEPDTGPAVRAVLEWAELRERAPGRLRPCANPECRLFLIDRSRANRARWCSMSGCGNRLKARRHYERTRGA